MLIALTVFLMCKMITNGRMGGAKSASKGNARILVNQSIRSDGRRANDDI